MYRFLLSSFVDGNSAATGITFSAVDDDETTNLNGTFVASNETASDQYSSSNSATPGATMLFLTLSVLVSFLVTPICCFIYCRRRSMIRPAEESRRRPRPTQTSTNATVDDKVNDDAVKRLKMLKKHFEQAELQKVLQAEDFETDGLDVEEGTAAMTIAEDDAGGVPEAPLALMVDQQVRHLSSRFQESSNYLTNRVVRLTPTRIEPNCCAICLSGYRAGETVVWSSNATCRHAFHHDCMLDWLVKIPAGDTLCPCCRQAFVDLP